MVSGPTCLRWRTLLSNDEDGNGTAYAKGALEAITVLCQLSAERLETIRKQVDALALDGVRVLGVAKASNIDVSQEQNAA